MSLVIYLDPIRPDRFILEGQGRYFVLRNKTHEILITGHFHTKPTHHPLWQLDKGQLDVEIRLFTTRIPNAPTYYHEKDVTYRIYIDTQLKEHKIYSLDYSREHDVLVDGKRFAAVVFDSIHPRDKLFDLRAMRFVRNDYSKKAAKAGLRGGD